MQTQLLRSLMVLNGYSIKSLSAEMGITSKSLGDKLNSKQDFWLHEVQKIKTVLKIEDADKVFF